jgi:hypothetical protein
MKIKTVLVAMTAIAALAGCNRGGGNNGAGGANNGEAAPNAAAAEAPAEVNRAAAAPREPQEILCHMGRCTYMRIDKQEIVSEAHGERLLRVTSARGSYPVPEGEFPESSRGLDIEWSAQPNDYYALCSTARPTLVMRKENGGKGWEGMLLDMHDGINFAGMDFYVHYSAACHPGEKVDEEGFAARHGYRNIEGTTFDLARPEDALNPRS